METRKNIAAEKKASGKYNCAQSVASTYCDLMGMSEQQALAVTAAFGTGFGTMQGTCGALVGAGVVAGVLTPDRVKARAQMGEMMRRFQERNGATVCSELKGVGTGKMLRHCNDCVADACELLEQVIAETGRS